MSPATKLVEALLENDVDPKDFVMGAQPDHDVTFVAQCPFTDQAQPNPRPNYYGGELQDWQDDWKSAEHFRLKDYVKNGVLDHNDLPFGTETIILVNPDGSPGEEIEVEALPGRFFGVDQVIDTYQAPLSNDMDAWNPQDDV